MLLLIIKGKINLVFSNYKAVFEDFKMSTWAPKGEKNLPDTPKKKVENPCTFRRLLRLVKSCYEQENPPTNVLLDLGSMQDNPD